MPDRSNECEPFTYVDDPDGVELFNYVVRNLYPHASDIEKERFDIDAEYSPAHALTYLPGNLGSTYEWMSFDFLNGLYQWSLDYGETMMAEDFVTDLINYKKEHLNI